MESKTMTITANFPTIEEFASKYPQYGPYAREEGYIIFETIMSVKSFIKAEVFTELGLPAVTGVAERCYSVAKDEEEIKWRGYLKQFIGAVVCALMEANNYSKTGNKASVPHHAFTKGEVYKLQGSK